MTFLSERPLFIPLRASFWLRFASGEKDVEYRVYGKRWNERTCRVGRAVTLSLGYGKRSRLAGRIVGFEVRADTASIPGWAQRYGHARAEPAACIRIEVSKENPRCLCNAQTAAACKVECLMDGFC